MTLAERPLDPDDYPEADRALLVPGSLVFGQTAARSTSTTTGAGGRTGGACWHRPEGPGSDTYTRGRHPVTQVAFEDAEPFAVWAGKSLRTEAEWERAARGNPEGAVFAWGDEFAPDGRLLANTWQGEFPWQNLMLDGRLGTSPVDAFPPNGFGLRDMCGNVWEWTSDFFTARHPDAARSPCCAPRVTSAEGSRVAREAGAHIARRVSKGGSHLCAPSYCLRYRPAARQGEAVDTSTSHIGFRCVMRAPRAE